MVYTQDELIKKLHLSKYTDIALYNNSPHSQELSLITSQDYLADLTHPFDVIFAHTFSLDEMKKVLLTFWEEESIRPNGIAYLIYPKLNNPYYPGIHRDDIFPALKIDDGLSIMPSTHYKFNKMVSLNDVFTIIGLKHLNEKDIQKMLSGQGNSKPSSRVGDYIKYIPEIEHQLSQINSTLAQSFRALTPGRQRHWAYDIYSARTQITRDKRLTSLISELDYTD